MKLNKHEKTGANTYELEIAIAPEQFKEAISAVYKREAKRYNVPGFRKGHAPRNLIEKMYGADIFHYDAINDVFPAAYEEAIKELELEPVARPEADVVSATVEDGAVLKVTVTVKPEIKIGKYKGLKATKTTEKVDEAKVDEEIARMQERNSRLITSDEAAKDGDIATIDYEGSVDGVPFDGGKDEGHRLTLGSGQFIPGFEEQVVGHKAGEEFDVKVTFPKEYHAENLAGKDAVFKVKLHEVQQKELQELDDEFAKDVSEYDTFAELKKSIRDDMQKHQDEHAERDTENKLVEQVVETIEGEIPEVMYDNRVDELVQDFAFRLEQQGLNLQTYLQYTGMDMEAFREGFKEQAKKQVEMRLALEAIVKLEKLVATEEDIDKEVERIAEQYKMEADKVRSIMPMDEVAKDLAVNKAIDLIKESATITEEKPKAKKAEKAEKAPAKKPAKKQDKKEDK
ncbi:trigger factor [Ruminococcaceae bacterium OttesenSCG-928-A16]|nr:trigger factor [Ruminococcaceae bacterium OttesenSCG-928-A16]